jgi:PAS domain S-box-containing protein
MQHLFTNAYFVISSICVAVGLLHLMIFLRRREETVHLVFACMALCCAVATALDIRMHTATTVADFARFLKATNTVQGLLWIAFAWFIQFYARGGRRWPVLLVSGLYGLAIVLNLIFPQGIIFSHIEDLDRTLLPWGESIAFGIGPANPWRLLADLAWFVVLAYTLDASVYIARQGERRRAWYFGLSILACLGVGYLHGTLVDLGILAPPSSWNFTFLALIILMSASLVDDVVSVPVLKREIASQMERWKSLVDNANMLVFGLDNQGRINFVNPHFLNITGFSKEEIIGRSLVDIAQESEKEELGSRIQKALENGNLPVRTQRALVTKTGQTRNVNWAHVLMRSPDGEITGTLSIGDDVTEIRQAQQALADEKARMDVVLSNLNTGLALMDKDLTVLWAQQELEALKTRLEDENLQLKEELLMNKDFEEIVGQSNAILYVLERVKQVAETDATVLIQGETGVGKELIASAIHRSSLRAAKPFVRVNCAALAPSLIESELFGHEAGAFTGANRMRKGRFEMADGGTLLLDEVSEIPLELQAKLLRVLQEGQFERVGGESLHTVDVRVIATTNRVLQDEVEKGSFRADLFYRLKVYPITVPPLRKHREDIELLVWHFLEEINSRVGKNIEKIPQSVMQALDRDGLSGQRARAEKSARACRHHLGNGILQLPETSSPDSPPETNASNAFSPISLDDVQRRHITHVLDHTVGRIEGPGGAAEILGLKPSTLRHRIKKLEIEWKKQTSQ